METRKRMVFRSLVAGTIFTFLFFLLMVRIYWIQGVNADWLVAEAQKQWERKSSIEPRRGAILDRNGNKLAFDGPAYNVVAILSKDYPHHITDPYDAARKLAPILGMEEREIAERLTQEGRFQVEIRPGGWKIPEEKARQIEKLGIPGIVLQKDTNRYYPNHKFAAHTIGFVDKDGHPRMGLELYYDEYLRGEPGSYRFIKDRKGMELPVGIEEFKPAKDGANLVTTIDQRIQQFVEQALDEAQANFNPKRMLAVVADPNTMEILAMSSRPHFDPNAYEEGIPNYKNLAINSYFEPGSTFKIITLAAAIEEGVFHPDETFQSGRYTDEKIRTPIRDHNRQGWGTITFKEGIQRSSNVASVILGYKRLGREKLSDYYKRFGFGEKTGIDYPNEDSGLLPDLRTAPPRDVAVTTFGQGVAVTAIQQLRAVAAVANGGKLLKPYLVKKILDPDTGEVIRENKPTVVQQVISPETSKMAREILETVVSSPKGTGHGYAIEGYRVAGKTGTAQKVDSQGGYAVGRYIYSFIGFAPADDPKLITYIVVEEPKGNVISSSEVVGPIFKSIMKNSLQYLQVSPEGGKAGEVSRSGTVEIPNVTNQYVETAKQQLGELGLRPEAVGKGEKVIRQFPEPGSTADINSRVYLLTEEDQILMPDFTGKSLREVVEFCSYAGVRVQIEGTGYVVEQSIKPGEPLKEGSTLAVRLAPPDQTR